MFTLTLSSRVLSNDKITYHLGGWRGPLGISLVIDGLSFFFSLIALGLGLLVIIYSIPERRYGRTYYFLLLVSLSSMIGVIYTADIFNMYVFYELLSLAVYLLIAYPKTGVTLRASFNYLIMGGVGLSFFLLGVGFLYAMTGTLDIFHIAERLPAAFNSSTRMVLMSFVLIATGMGIKIAVFPLHGWLPDAHSMAPSPVSALLSGVTVKIGIYCLIRVVYTAFSAEMFFLINSYNILMVLGVVSLLFGASMALVQKDLKRLLAYSTINQLGIVLIGLGIRTELGLIGALFHVLNHAIMKSTLFFCAGIMIYETGTREVQGLSGFNRQQPAITFAFVIASLGMIGIPPINGFASKWLICLAAVEAGYTVLVVIILIASAISAAYYFRVIQVLFSGPLEQNPTPTYGGGQVVHEGNFFKALPIYILAAGCLLLGLLPALGISLVKPAVGLLLSSVTP
ncbi:MAG: proton-conducting transporter membrane subunit [Atribacterota bacterium]|nr:proton-conducting transporter membrane subunit [Atribacterota bacterium]